MVLPALLTGIRSRLGRVGLEGADFGTLFFHGSFIQLVLAGGGVVAGTWVGQAEEANGVHWAEVVGQDGDTMAVEVDGAGVCGGSAHKESGGGELNGIENGDGQNGGMLVGAAEKLVVSGKHDIRLHRFRSSEMERVEAFEPKLVQFDAAFLNGRRKGLV